MGNIHIVYLSKGFELGGSKEGDGIPCFARSLVVIALRRSSGLGAKYMISLHAGHSSRYVVDGSPLANLSSKQGRQNTWWHITNLSRRIINPPHYGGYGGDLPIGIKIQLTAKAAYGLLLRLWHTHWFRSIGCGLHDVFHLLIESLNEAII